MIELEFLFDLTAEVGELVSLGPCPLGERRVVYITGGRFEGPAMRGRIVGGADWQILRSDGALELDARYAIEDEGGGGGAGSEPGLPPWSAGGDGAARTRRGCGSRKLFLPHRHAFRDRRRRARVAQQDDRGRHRRAAGAARGVASLAAAVAGTNDQEMSNGRAGVVILSSCKARLRADGRLETPMRSPSPEATRSGNLAGIGLMLTGIALFSINDALGKWLLVTYSVGELLLVRSATALILLAPFVHRAGIPAFRRAPRPAPPARSHRALDARGGDVLLGGFVPAAGGYRDLLSRRPDLRDGAFGAAARRAGRLAPLERRAGRLRRGSPGAAPIGGEPHPAGDDRAHRQHLLRACS